jgi:hypothetical protein
MERKTIEEGLASAGTFCPNKECHHYAKVDEGNLIKFGKSKQGVQRYQCKSCTTTFVATRGTLSFIASTLLSKGHPRDPGTSGGRSAHKQPLASEGLQGGHDLEVAT